MKYITTSVLIALSFLSSAQQPAAKVKAQNIYFYKKGYVEVSTKDSADIIQVISEPDSGETLFNVDEFYKNGKVRFHGKSSQVHPVVLQEQSISYYTNGSKNTIVSYVDNTPVNEMRCYYPNGKIYYIINYLKKDSLDAKKKTNIYRDTLFEFAYDSTGKTTVENGNGYFKKYDDI